MRMLAFFTLMVIIHVLGLVSALPNRTFYKNGHVPVLFNMVITRINRNVLCTTDETEF